MVRRKAASESAVAELWQEFRGTSGPERLTARNQLVEFYMPIVRSVAQKIKSHVPASVDVEDLCSDGVVGLMQAIESFAPEKNIKFETYSALRIRGAMLDGLRELDWVPRLVRSKTAKLNRATTSLERELGRTPTPRETANRLGISVDDLERLAQEVVQVLISSLDSKTIFEQDDRPEQPAVLKGLLYDPRARRPSERLQRQDFLRKVTKGLSKDERLIVILYYYEDFTMREIGRTLDLSESRVSQMHSAIISRLRLQLRDARRDLGADAARS